MTNTKLNLNVTPESIFSYRNSMYTNAFYDDYSNGGNNKIPLLSSYVHKFVSTPDFITKLDVSKYEVVQSKYDLYSGIKYDEWEDINNIIDNDVTMSNSLYYAIRIKGCGVYNGILAKICYEDSITAAVKLDTGEMICLCSLEILYSNTIDFNNILKFRNDLLSNITQYDYNLYLQPKINLLISTRDGLDTTEFKVKVPDIDFGLNYNEDFQDVNDSIIKNLNLTKGLFILNGDPGTGKTMYIRYLIGHMCNVMNKKVLYIPSHMVSSLSDPSLVSILSDNAESILVIEDADDQIKKRSSSEPSSVANILNITDGFLNDCFNIQVILTYNIDTSSVDDALLRAGRLLNKYTFTSLSADRATKLSKKIGHNITYESPVALTKIYNPDKTGGETQERKKIGF